MPDDDTIQLDTETLQALRDEIRGLRRENQRLRHDGNCRYAGPGRGDCEHFVGLPGESIPGQHDGDDDTVDHYGKPNGWCWHCWLMHERDRLQRELRETSEDVTQLRTQLAGCLTAAEGATNPEHVAERDMYGWSLAYETTIRLHRAYEEALRRLRVYTGEPEEPEDEVERPSRWDVLGSG